MITYTVNMMNTKIAFYKLCLIADSIAAEMTILMIYNSTLMSMHWLESIFLNSFMSAPGLI